MSSNPPVVTVGAGVIGLLLGIALGFLLDRGATPVRPNGNAPATTGPGPSDTTNGVPIGYSRTATGAVAAAANFNLLSGVIDPLNLDALTLAMQTAAAPDWTEQSAAEAREGYEYVARTYGDDAEVTSAVLRYDVDDFTPDRASVSLWTVSLLAGSKRPNVEAAWGVVQLDLVWIDGDWRLAGMESSPGPAPVELPAAGTARTAQELMEDFSEFPVAPAP